MRVWQDSAPAEQKKIGWVYIGAAMLGTVLLIVVALLISFNMRTYLVSGQSMLPTLIEGDRVKFGASAEPGYGDIVVFHSDYDLLVKRVIGLPGDIISVSADGQVTRNGEKLDEPYIMKDKLNNSETGEVTVSEGCVFVMGDNRGASVDSRDIRVGQIKSSMVCGCVTEFTREIRTDPEEAQ